MDKVMIGLLLLAVLSLINLVNAQKNRMKYMGEKLDCIIKHLDIEDNTLDETLMEFIDIGQDKAATKILRERTGMEVTEAKEYLERLAAE